jgi:hypothetical protein
VPGLAGASPSQFMRRFRLAIATPPQLHRRPGPCHRPPGAPTRVRPRDRSAPGRARYDEPRPTRQWQRQRLVDLDVVRRVQRARSVIEQQNNGVREPARRRDLVLIRSANRSFRVGQRATNSAAQTRPMKRIIARGHTTRNARKAALSIGAEFQRPHDGDAARNEFWSRIVRQSSNHRDSRRRVLIASGPHCSQGCAA